MTGRKILVVDDHVDLAENISEILAGAGYHTIVANSAEAALERLDAGDVAALITDFRLPGRSGAELIAELRRRGSDIPAVVMSAYTDEETIESSQRAGAFDVLPKPVDLGRLMSLVEMMGGDDAIVLVVDDNRALAENFAEALRARGYQALVGTSGADALAPRTRPRAAVLDFRLPDVSGVEVAERLTNRDPRIRIVFVSAYAGELRPQLRGRLAGTETMEKPVDVAHLVSWVARALDDGKATRTRR